MAKDDLTQKLLINDEDRTTQPTLLAVFDLVREVKEGMDRGYAGLGASMTELGASVASLQADVTELRAEVAELRAEVAELRAEVTRLSSRVDAIESRLARDIAGLGYKIEALNKSRLQTEADYTSLFDRVKELESKIP